MKPRQHNKSSVQALPLLAADYQEAAMAFRRKKVNQVLRAGRLPSYIIGDNMMGTWERHQTSTYTAILLLPHDCGTQNFSHGRQSKDETSRFREPCHEQSECDDETGNR